MDTHRVWEQYDYRDINGKGYEVQVRRYQDERVERMARIYRESEMVQAAHRVRPVVNSGNREIIILSNIPIPQLAPTHLTSAEELAKSSMPINPTSIKTYKALLREATRISKDIMLEFGYIRATLLQSALREWYDDTVNNNTFDDNSGSLTVTAFPVLRTLERWVRDIAYEEGWDSLRCTVTNRFDFNGSGAVSIIIFHDGVMGIEDILEYAKADYIKMKGLTEEEVEDLIFDWEFFNDDIDPYSIPVIDSSEPPDEWYDRL